MLKRSVVAFVSLGLLSACSTPLNKTTTESQSIEIRLDGQFNPDSCHYLGTVTGSEGHWYNYLFFGNDVLIQGAVNQLKNNAHQLGANTIYAITTQNFTTSVSLLGTAYYCETLKSGQRLN
ncbi:DUF4156 domain-containing protein [Vibrio cidicii]|uniref:DUF4156 domain-containing protein n=1 Tax=Vibrio cidicii TaxID=1763883 RepID=UPI0018C310FA|nr:DUF4156 domain-containing protein [Vibrio cidicii]MBG0754556.1 hypothetical protein [Vibrio cidicii]